jgi:hypothetical protein
MATGDGENHRVYAPLPPVEDGAESLFSPHLVVVHGIGEMQIDWSSTPLFSAKVCSYCGNPAVERTASSLRLSSIRSRGNGASAQGFYLFSEEFVATLSDRERSSFDWRPVETKKRTHRRYLECRAKNPVALRGKRGISVRNECEYCGSPKGYIHDLRLCPVLRLVSRADLSEPLPSVFGVGSTTSTELCMTAERWNQLAKTEAAKGLDSSDVGVLDANEVEDELFTLREYARMQNGRFDRAACDDLRRRQESFRQDLHSARRGDTRAALALAEEYELGTTVKQDLPAARRWLEFAQQRGAKVAEEKLRLSS